MQAYIKFVWTRKYHATEIQLEGSKSQLLYFLSSGNWDARTEICVNQAKQQDRTKSTSFSHRSE